MRCTEEEEWGMPARVGQFTCLGLLAVRAESQFLFLLCCAASYCSPLLSAG